MPRRQVPEAGRKELELIEPDLFRRMSPGSHDRFAAMVEQYLA